MKVINTLKDAIKILNKPYPDDRCLFMLLDSNVAIDLQSMFSVLHDREGCYNEVSVLIQAIKTNLSNGEIRGLLAELLIQRFVNFVVAGKAIEPLGPVSTICIHKQGSKANLLMLPVLIERKADVCFSIHKPELSELPFNFMNNPPEYTSPRLLVSVDISLMIDGNAVHSTTFYSSVGILVRFGRDVEEHGNLSAIADFFISPEGKEIIEAQLPIGPSDDCGYCFEVTKIKVQRYAEILDCQKQVDYINNKTGE